MFLAVFGCNQELYIVQNSYTPSITAVCPELRKVSGPFFVKSKIALSNETKKPPITRAFCTHIQKNGHLAVTGAIFAATCFTA
jgi:hypothetical protein